MSEELKPCPFCGNPVITNSEHRPLCQYCAYLFRVDFWNTRPIEDALRAENDRLTAEVARLKVALEMYADERNWMIDVDWKDKWLEDFNGYDIARAALAETEKTK